MEIDTSLLKLFKASLLDASNVVCDQIFIESYIFRYPFKMFSKNPRYLFFTLTCKYLVMMDFQSLNFKEVLSVPHRFLLDSGGMQIGRGLCQYCYSCCFLFRWNPCIPELILECSPEFTRMECNWNAFTGIVFNL